MVQKCGEIIMSYFLYFSVQQNGIRHGSYTASRKHIYIDKNKEWLDENIIGVWEVTHLWNAISGIWVDANWGYSDAKFTFNPDKTVKIENFDIDNGTWNYNIASEDYTTFIVINDVKRMVFSLNMNDKTLTLYNYAKLKKK